MSKATLRLIREQRKTKRFYQRTGDPLLKTAFNNLTGKVKRAIAKEKQEAWQRATEDLNSLQGAQLWKQFHNLTGTGKPSRVVTKLEDENGEVARGEEDIAAAFANHLEKSHRKHEGPQYCEATRIHIAPEV